MKEALKRFHPSSGYYFRNRKGSWFSPTESCIDYRELSLVLQKKTSFVYIAVLNYEKLRTWPYTYTRAVRQQTVHQKTTMANTGTLRHYLYSNKISEIAKTTEAYSADTVSSSDVEKEVPKRGSAT